MLSDLVISSAVGCSTTWLYNASRLLHTEIQRTPNDTRWWRLVRLIHTDLGLPLRAAAKIADATLNGLASTKVRLNATPDGSVAIQLDMDRFLSSSSAALSSARNFSVAAPRGRPPKKPRQDANADTSIYGAAKTPTVRLGAFDAHGADVRVLLSSKQGVLTAIYDPSPKNLDRVAAALTALRAKHRGIPDNWPNTIDAITIRTVPRLALTTSDGPLDLIPRED